MQGNSYFSGGGEALRNMDPSDDEACENNGISESSAQGFHTRSRSRGTSRPCEARMCFATLSRIVYPSRSSSSSDLEEKEGEIRSCSHLRKAKKRRDIPSRLIERLRRALNHPRHCQDARGAQKLLQSSIRTHVFKKPCSNALTCR